MSPSMSTRSSRARSSPSCQSRGGLTLDEVEQVFGRVRERTTILGAGFSALAAEPENVEPLTRLALALGL